MSDFNGYAVFFFPNAIEALGEAIAPYLQDSPGGPHILCRDIDVGGALAELTLEGRTTDGRELDLELMFPTNMVRMIVSARSDPGCRVERCMSRAVSVGRRPLWRAHLDERARAVGPQRRLGRDQRGPHLRHDERRRGGSGRDRLEADRHELER